MLIRQDKPNLASQAPIVRMIKAFMGSKWDELKSTRRINERIPRDRASRFNKHIRKLDRDIVSERIGMVNIKGYRVVSVLIIFRLEV